MNLVLLEAADFVAPGRAVVGGRRLDHLREVLRVSPGDQVAVGQLAGQVGKARIIEIGERAVLECALDRPPPERSTVDLLVALPRPKILRKVLQAVASMGISRLVLLGSYKVEKSYFQSPLLEPAALREQLMLGLEQAGDTILPEVLIRRFFKPFAQDELGALFPDHRRLLAHPAAQSSLPGLGPGKALLAIGPEGGWTAYEAGLLEELGFQAWSLGRRILRVDVALPWAVAQVELAARGLLP